MDTAAAAIVTMMMKMMMDAHPLPPQTVVFNLSRIQNSIRMPLLSSNNAWLSGGICMPHTSQKPHAKKGIAQSFDHHKGGPSHANGSRLAHVN